MDMEVKEIGVIGGACGALLWLYDFRHIFLGGPPRAFISGAMGNLLPLSSLCAVGDEGANAICGFVATLLVLTFAGAMAGMALAGLMRIGKR